MSTKEIEFISFHHYPTVMTFDPRLRLRHVRAFLAVARAGSLTAAAEELHITQPAASKTIRELEDVLGAPLFDRTGRRLRPNEAGRAFATYAGRAWSDLARAQQAARGPGAGARIAVGVLPTAATDLLPRAATAFAGKHPGAVLRAVTGPNWLLLSQLREGALDLVVGRMAAPEAMEGLLFEQLYAEEVILAARPGHSLAGRSGLGAEIGDWPLILPPPGALIAPPVMAWLAAEGLGAPRARFETVSLAFGRRVLELSDAVWFISRGVVADELVAGRLVALSLRGPVLAGPLGVSTRDDAAPSMELDTLRQALREAARAARDAA